MTWRDTLQAGLGTSYHIRQELGGGGMSTTYVAEEVALGRSVVLKVLSPELASGVSAERFEHEIHLAARLQHAFIVPLLAAGVTDGIPWYTMPLVQGESLRARIAREGALTATATARILRDIAEALACAHAQGIVHRDIKPDNILLSGSHALVTDFGVAKAIAASTTSAAVTRTGTAIGTPAYMAPEQAAGDASTDHRADLYSLGVMAYEMLTGKQLFGHGSPARMLIAHATEKPESVASIAPTTPPELAGLVDQLLAKHPNDRPAHAQDVADALGVMITRWTSGELPAARGRITMGQALVLWAVVFASASGIAWLGVRWLPIPEWTVPAVVLLMLAGLPVLLLTVWLHRPARPIVSVPSVSSATTVGRIEAVVRPHVTFRRTARLGVAAFGVIVLLAAAWGVSRALGIGPAASLRSQGKIAASDRVFVADFESPPNDTGLGAVVTDLMRTELARSASIRFVTANERSYALIALGRPASTRVHADQARDVSQRANAKAFLDGSVTQLGSGYLLRARVVETATGNDLATFTESAHSADDIIRAVDRMGRDIRDRLGASLREVRSDAPLYFAVTPSLEAARLYTQAIDVSNQDQPAAIRLLQRAVEIDTQFADAYRRMAAHASNLGDRERAAWASERAFRFRTRLPLSLQRAIEGTYYNSPTAYDLARSIAAYESSIELVQNGISVNNLAMELTARRDFERALDTWRTALKVDSLSGFAPYSIVGAMWRTGHKDEARRYVATTLPRWQPGNPRIHILEAQLAFADLRVDSAERLLILALRDSARIPSNTREQLSGLLSAARRTQGRSTPSDDESSTEPLGSYADSVGRVPVSVLRRAEIAAWDQERPAEARRILDSIVAVRPPGDASAVGYRWLELARQYAVAGDASKARALLSTYEQRASDHVKAYDRQSWQLARGWTAVAEKRYADAVTAFRAADVGTCTVCALAPLATAYDLSGQADSAIAVFERYLRTPFLSREQADQRYLAGTYKRLGELYEAKGDRAKAASYYAKFVELWKNADPVLQPKVTEVRRRLARLSDRERR